MTDNHDGSPHGAPPTEAEQEYHLSFETIEVVNRLFEEQTVKIDLVGDNWVVQALDADLTARPQSEVFAWGKSFEFFGCDDGPEVALIRLVMLLKAKDIKHELARTVFPDTPEYRKREVVGKVQGIRVILEEPPEVFWSKLADVISGAQVTH